MPENKDTRTITIEIPDTMYIAIREYAKDYTRTTENQAKYFLDVGLQVLEQQIQQEIEEEQAIIEAENAPKDQIGFKVDSPDMEYEEEEDIKSLMIKILNKLDKKVDKLK